MGIEPSVPMVASGSQIARSPARRLRPAARESSFSARVLPLRGASNAVIACIGSVQLEVGALDDLLPLFMFGLNLAGEDFGRTANGLHAKLQQLVLDLLGGEDVVDRTVELEHDRTRRTGRGHHAAP